jgi:hypothetical protein
MTDIDALAKKVAALEKELAEVKKMKGKRVKRAPSKWNLFLAEFTKKNHGKYAPNEMMAAASKVYHK